MAGEKRSSGSESKREGNGMHKGKEMGRRRTMWGGGRADRWE